MSEWLVQRECIDCGGECFGDVAYPTPRCGTCWLVHTGASQSNAQYRVRPSRVENVRGRKYPGRYVRGSYVYWDDEEKS